MLMQVVPSAGFGQQQQQPASGTRTVPWRKTAAASDSAGSKSDGNYFSITAMQEYSSKSFEELRWEDYQVVPCNFTVFVMFPKCLQNVFKMFMTRSQCIFSCNSHAQHPACTLLCTVDMSPCHAY